ncbi:MAG: DHH family phosphoesterase, partial [Candidatus Micrarchaeota archaeon]|nr:DHH family phosphoesterase [Candidatus Micrarchaeota archaeon]
MGKKTSSSKFRPSSAASLFSGIGKRRVLITFHSLGDLDAVGSAIAMQRFLGKKAIIAPPDKPSSTARKLIEYTGTKTTLFSEAAYTSKDFLIALDSSSPHLLAHLAGINPDIIIDHHTRFGGEISAKQDIVDPVASSTCEMLYFMLKPTDRITSLALLLGLISDSGNFKYATPRTFEA